MKNSYSHFSKSATKSYDEGLREYMVNVYKQMCLSLAFTVLIALSIVSSKALSSLFFGTPLGMIVSLAPLGISWYMSAKFMSISTSNAQVLMFLIAGCVGASISYIGLIFDPYVVLETVFATCSIFGIMSIYGYSTKSDLTAMGSFALMGIFGIVIVSLFNLFMQSPVVDYIISIVGVIAFVIMIAYDTQRIKDIYYNAPAEISDKISVYGALSLYFNFINLFLLLLRLFGNSSSRRD